LIGFPFKFSSATYPANLCPLFGRAEFAGFGENLGQPIRKSVEAVSRRALRHGATEHFDCVLSEEQRVNDTIQAGAWRKHWCFRLWGQMPRLRARQAELALQIIGGDLDVPHRHPWIFVAEEFHERGYGYARANHLAGVGVPKLVRNDAGGNAGRGTDLVQVETQLAD
jgi:hypothetical protein